MAQVELLSVEEHLGLPDGVPQLDADAIVKPVHLPVAPPLQAQGTYREFGGAVAFLSNLSFRVAAGRGVINGSRVTWPQTDVTLAAADGSNPRQDSIVVQDNGDGTGTPTSVAGTPAASPPTPDLSSLTQLFLAYALVPAGATALTIGTTTVYDEDDDWTSSDSGAAVDPASTSAPLTGTKSVLFTNAASGDYVRFTKGAPAISLADAKQLHFSLKPAAAFPNAKSIRVTWYLAGVKVGQSVTLETAHGFVKSSTASQLIAVPISAFQIPATATVDRVEFYVNGGGAAVTFRLDDVTIESNSTAVTIVTVGPASATQSGTVKTKSTVPDPVAAFHGRDLPLTFQFGDSLFNAVAGMKLRVRVSGYSANFKSWHARLGASGSATFTVRVATSVTNAFASVGGTQPSVTTAVGAEDTDGLNWTTTGVSDGYWVEVELTSITTAADATLVIVVTPT